MKKLNILIVDDDFINRKLIKTYLKHNPKMVDKIFEASDGSEALEILKDKRDEIDLIILDLLMPILDGKEFLKIFRQNPKNSKIPVIVLTTDDSKKASVLNSGADDFLIKPIKEEELIKHLNYWASLPQ